jgi:hypothetical protein
MAESFLCDRWKFLGDFHSRFHRLAVTIAAMRQEISDDES